MGWNGDYESEAYGVDSSTSSTSTSTSTDNGNDNNDFFTGTFDNPGEPGFSGPSYPGQTGLDSDGDFYSASDVGVPTDDYIPGWSVLGYPGPSYDQPQDMFDVVGDYYSNIMDMGLPESDGDSSGGLAPPSSGGGNLPTSYYTETGIPVTDYSMTREMIETGYRTVGFQGLMEPAKIGPKAAVDFPEEYYTSTFLSREKQLRASKRMTDVEAQAYADYLGLSVEIEKREEITGNVVERALETVARSFADQISARFGAPAATPYVAGLQEDYLGKVTDDYALTDFIGNVIGMKVPGGAEVDTALSEDITGREMGERISQIGTSMFGDTSVIGTPQEIEQMWADSRAEADAERARGGDDPTVTTTVSPVGAALTRPRSRLLRSFLGVAGPRIYPLFYKEGGVVQKKAVGGETLDQQMQGAMQEPTSGDGPTGFVGDRPENLSEAKTVADDVPLEVEEGTFIINAAAVEFAGSEDIKQMILDAIYEARAQGVDISGDENKIERERAVSLLVSEGEVVVPPLLAKIIGYDKLNKINNRGKQEVEKRVQENGQSQEAEALDEQPANPSEGAAMAPGGTAGDILFEEMPYATVEGPENRARVLNKAKEADPEGFAEIQRKNTDDLADWMNISQFYTDDYVAKSPAPIQKLDRFLLENAAYNMSVQYGSEDNMFIMLGERGKDPDPARGLKTGRVGDKDAIITLPGEEKDAPLLYHESGHVAQPRDLEQSTLQLLKNQATDLFKSLTRPAGEPGKPQEEVAVTSLDLYRALHQGDTEKVIGSIEYLNYHFKRQGFGREFVPDFTTDEGVEKLARNAAEYALEVVDSQNLYSKEEKQSLVQDITNSFTKNAETIKKLGAAYRSGEYNPTVEAYRRNRMAPGGFVSAEGQGSTGKTDSSAYKQANVAATYEGDGFVVRPRANYDERTNTQEYPDGVVVNEKGKSIGFAMDGQMFLSDDKSIRAGFERQATNTEGRVNLPEQYGGETIEFGGGSKMKRYNMGATFGPLDVDISKTQLPGGDSVMGGSARYRFSESGDVTLEAMDDGRSGRIALNYRF